MKFIVDAQLPKKLARWLREIGHDAIHTLDLPEKNRTDDMLISEISMREKRVVISKDSDFFDRYFQKLEPYKLLFLTTGNIHNDDLMLLFKNNIDLILSAVEESNVVELSQTTLTSIA